MAIVEELLQWTECDAVIHMGIIGRRIMIKAVLESTIAVDKRYDLQFLEENLMRMETFETELVVRTVKMMEKYHKPIVGVYLLSDDKTPIVTEINGCKYKGVNFTTPERAVKALAKMYKYAQWLKT
jgi:acyl-CoA synthetase (NDP forming)